MYIAQRDLKVSRNGSLAIIKAGEPVVDFESWNLHAQRAHLNLEWVTKSKDEELPEENLPAEEEVDSESPTKKIEKPKKSKKKTPPKKKG